MVHDSHACNFAQTMSKRPMKGVFGMGHGDSSGRTAQAEIPKKRA